METIPIFIISCDRLEVLKQSIQSYCDFIKTPFEIIIIDFGSSYKPTIKYLKNLERKKVRIYWREKIMRKFHLHSVDEVIQDYFKDHPESNYVVTDPDIALDNVKGDVLEVYAHLLKRLHKITVVGPMLKINDIPDYYPKKGDVINWEMRHNPPIKRVKRIQYEGKSVKYIPAHIDSTFGMNRAGMHWRRYSIAVRVLSPYSAKHLDWYLDSENLTPDQIYYMEHASEKITHWSQWE